MPETSILVSSQPNSTVSQWNVSKSAKNEVYNCLSLKYPCCHASYYKSRKTAHW